MTANVQSSAASAAVARPPAGVTQPPTAKPTTPAPTTQPRPARPTAVAARSSAPTCPERSTTPPPRSTSSTPRSSAAPAESKRQTRSPTLPSGSPRKKSSRRPRVEGDLSEDSLQELSGPAGSAHAATPEQASGAPIRKGNRAIGFLRASWAELQRVQWPDRRQVTQATAVVLGFVAIAGLYLGLADYVAKEFVELIL